MSAALAFLASTRLMLAGLALLAAGMFAVHDDPAAPAWPIVAPLVLLALNLAAAIGAHRRLRRGGLGVFHVALLALLVVAAGGRLARLEGRVELTEGQAFTADAMDVTLRELVYDFAGGIAFATWAGMVLEMVGLTAAAATKYALFNASLSFAITYVTFLDGSLGDALARALALHPARGALLVDAVLTFLGIGFLLAMVGVLRRAPARAAAPPRTGDLG